MTVTLYVLLSMLIGAGMAMQLSMLGAMGRERGSFEGAWLSLIGSATGLALVLAVRAVRSDALLLPSPLDRFAVQALIAAVSGSLLVISFRGVEPYFAITGLFAVPFLIGAAFLVPEIGVARFFGAVTAGTFIGVVVLDHLGVFGAEPQHVTAFRLAGVALLLVGVVLVRSGR